MSKALPLAAALAMAFSTATFGQPSSQNAGPNQPAEAPEPQQRILNPAAGAVIAPAAVPLLSDADRAFVERATRDGMAEIAEDRLAKQMAEATDVKSLGQRLETAQAATDDQLALIAQKEGIKAPSELTPPDEQQLSTLQQLQGTDFDRRYIDDRLSANRRKLALFEAEAQTGNDPQLKQYAAQTVPTLQQNLLAVEALVGRK
jgi:putative membrane protein